MSSLSRLFRRTFATSLSQSSSNDVRSLSDDPYKEHNLKRLVEKFKKSSEVDRFLTKTGIYDSTVRRLASAKHFGWIEEILEDQKKYANMSKEGFNVRLITLYGKSGMFDHASKVFDEMPDYKCDRTVLSFNALLGACVNAKKFDMVDVYFRTLPEKLAVKPDVVSYNIVVKAFREMGSLDSAVSTVDEMEKTGLEPDLITFNTHCLMRFMGTIGLWTERRFGRRWRRKMWFLILGVTMQGWLGWLVRRKCQKQLIYLENWVQRGSKLMYLCVQLAVDELVEGSKIGEAKKVVELGMSNNYYRCKLKLLP
ncbi:tetratricopeptide repeat (TPR)-like superfamily protein [Actinidia rufa]|uniref:Tetratricopeptide repeat (TPR)-like superfamily protein n=1 Tax=Actinidia rufa TaxID=165716 RepID=A0A7J0FWT7_9ERIC|nr:tetratricopeptide repeat (TPR)-like superfamily protein [Actinidia rufa]